MAKFDYTTLREDKIVPLIERFGTSVVLKRTEDTSLYKKEYDPSEMRNYWEDTVTGERFYTKPEPTQKEYKGICLNTRYTIEDIDGTNVQMGDRRLLAMNIPKPETGEILTVSGEDFAVVIADEVAPGDTLLFYRIQVRI